MRTSRQENRQKKQRKTKIIYALISVIIIIVFSVDIYYKNTHFFGVKLKDYDIIRVIYNGTIYPIDTEIDFIPRSLRYLERYLSRDEAGIAGFSPAIPYTDVGSIKWAEEFEEQHEQEAYHLYVELKHPQTIKIPSKYFGLKREKVSSFLITRTDSCVDVFWKPADSDTYFCFMYFSGDKRKMERKKTMDIIRELIE